MLQTAPVDAPASTRPSTPTPVPHITPSILDRLAAYAILPPGHEAMSQETLVLLEQVFVTWYEMHDDASRRATIPYLFTTDAELRTTLLAVVPLYFDPLFFDELTPTRDLVTLALAAHEKWRAWLDGSRC